MRISGYHREWDAHDEAGLDRVLEFRDAVGGAEFWLSIKDDSYPVVSIRVSGALADVHYFPEEGHPGFRALAAPESTQEQEAPDVRFRYEGCDPASGEDVPGQFVLPFSVALDLAREFYRTGAQPSSAAWFEL